MFGSGARAAKSRGAQAALRELAEQQKTRAKRLQRDALDRALTDLISFYRDVLVIQTGATTPLVNEEMRAELSTVAQRSTPEISLRRVESILACRQAVEANVPPLLAAEAMMVALR